MSETQTAVLNENELEAKVREQLDTEYQEKLKTQMKEIADRMTVDNQKMVTEAIEKIRKDMAPPSQADMQKLLDQEYL